MKEILNGYLERSRSIRHFSIPPRDKTVSEDQFYELFQNNFLRIKELFCQNKEMLENQVYARLQQQETLDDELAEELLEFSDNLADTGTLETVDTRLALTIIDGLETHYGMRYRKTGEQKELEKQIHCMYRQLTLCYNVALIYDRGILTQELSDQYRERILDCADKGKRYLEDFSVFRRLPLEIQEELIKMQLFRATGYERSFYDEQLIRCQISSYRECIDLFSRREFQLCSPEIDWEYHIFSAYNFLCLVHEFLYWKKIPDDILEELERAADYEIAYIEHHPDNCRSTMEAAQASKSMILFYRGEKSFEEVMQTYKDWHASGNLEMYDKSNMDANLLAVACAQELCKNYPQYLEEEREFLNEAVQHAFQYIDRPVDEGTYETLQRYSSYLLEDYVELEGGISFRRFYENLLIATQPPLYVHSRMVGLISDAILRAVFAWKPELLEGVRGHHGLEDIRDSGEEIREFLAESALLHDAGKMYYSDTINLYNRILLPEEFRLIRFHSLSGYKLLSGYASTRDYAEAALYHHLWYYEQGGYPQGYHFRDTPNAILYQIITCGDCIDAATDAVGRAYSQGKSFDILLEELRKGSGTQYHPELVELFEHQELREEIENLITWQRRELYYQAFFRYKNSLNKNGLPQNVN